MGAAIFSSQSDKRENECTTPIKGQKRAISASLIAALNIKADAKLHTTHSTAGFAHHVRFHQKLLHLHVVYRPWSTFLQDFYRW
ncbi:hypothetical protein HYQ46_003210 [Verticillium longisporum]|nr:hypothetical protein HYQ46_003210 [Verticillium longisporum]